MYILTFGINDYKQHGAYFGGAWTNEPTAKQIVSAISDMEDNEVFINIDRASELIKNGVQGDGYWISFRLFSVGKKKGE